MGTAGCSVLRGSDALTDPTVGAESPRRKHLQFTDDGSELATFGVDGTVDGTVVSIRTELAHRAGTSVTRLAIRTWMPDREADAAPDVALVSPVEGDSSPPPTVSLATPHRMRGTVVEVTDFDDLADETITTVDLLVRPRGGEATTVAIDVDVDLATDVVLGTDYDLSGRLELAFPDIAMA